MTAHARGGSLSFGLYLSTQQVPGSDMGDAFGDQLRLARAAEDAGWDSVWGGQHYLSHDYTQLQPLPFLARLAAEVPRMDIGLGIHLLALQNPVAVAEDVAALDVVTGGRFTYGVGLGYRDVEFDAFGVPRSSAVERFEANLRIIRALWNGESVTVDLPWCKLTDQRLSIARLGDNDVWMAANSDGAVRRAAALADAWLVNPHARLDTLIRQLDIFRRTREDQGLPPVSRMPVIKELFCARTRREALSIAGPWLLSKYDTYTRWGQDQVLPLGDRFSSDLETLRDERFVIGTPEDCVAELERYKSALGATDFILRVQWPGMPMDPALECIELLATEVFPALR